MIGGIHACPLRTIAEHTVNLLLLNRDSKVLDLGCRSFAWSNAMLEYVDKVYCVDADNTVKSFDKRLPVLNAAISDVDDKPVLFIKFGNGTGNFVDRPGRVIPAKSKIQKAETATIATVINSAFGPGTIDLIKMDIEGEEISVLLSLKEPPAKQLSIEFHLHTGTKESEVQKVFRHLEIIGYINAFQDYSEKHGCGLNYWDVLFILKLDTV